MNFFDLVKLDFFKPSQITKMIKNAFAGDYTKHEQYVYRGEDYTAIYEDDEVRGTWQKRVRAVQSLNWRLEGQNSDAVNKSLDNVLTDFIANAMDAILFGASYQNLTVTQEGNDILAKKVTKIEPSWIKTDKNGIWLNKGESILKVAAAKEEPEDASFFWHLSGATYSKPNGDALLRYIKPIYCAKKNNENDYIMWSKRYSHGFLLHKVDNADAIVSTDENGNALTRGEASKQNIEKAQSGAAFIMNSSDSLEVWQPNGTAASTFFERNKQLNKQIQKFILGESTTSGDDEGGSLAKAKVADDVRTETTASDVEFVRSYVQELIDRIALANNAAAPKIVFEKRESGSVEKASMIESLYKSDVRITAKGLYDIMGYDADQFIVGEQSAEKKSLSLASGKKFNFDAKIEQAEEEQNKIDALVLALIATMPASLTAIYDAAQSAGSIDELVVLLNELPPADFAQLESAIRKAEKIGADGAVEDSKAEEHSSIVEVIAIISAANVLLKKIRAAVAQGLSYDEAKTIVYNNERGKPQPIVRDGTIIAPINSDAGYDKEAIAQEALQNSYQRQRMIRDIQGADSQTWLEYVAIRDERTRPSHAAMSGFLAPATSDVWRTWYPPNGYNCRCTVIKRDFDEIKERELKPIVGVPDKGFEDSPLDYVERLKVLASTQIN